MKICGYPAEQYVSVALVTVLGLLLADCQSKPQSQPPTAEEQKKIDQDYQKTMEQQKKLTSGYDKSMQYVPPSTGYVPSKASSGTQKAGSQRQHPVRQQPAQQQKPQSQPKQ